MSAAAWPVLVLLGGLAACGDRERAAGAPTRAADAGVAAAPARGTTAAASDARLDGAARRIVAFLRAELPFDSLALADTVELRVAPEGGGAARRLSRDALRDRAAWTVAAPRSRISFVPPEDYSIDSTLVGRHFDCLPHDLATRAPDLASRPHVGVRLQPPNAGSCLQSWNATFVFDAAGSTPRLVAVLYDQFEW